MAIILVSVCLSCFGAGESHLLCSRLTTNSVFRDQGSYIVPIFKMGLAMYALNSVLPDHCFVCFRGNPPSCSQEPRNPSCDLG